MPTACDHLASVSVVMPRMGGTSSMGMKPAWPRASGTDTNACCGPDIPGDQLVEAGEDVVGSLFDREGCGLFQGAVAGEDEVVSVGAAQEAESVTKTSWWNAGGVPFQALRHRARSGDQAPNAPDSPNASACQRRPNLDPWFRRHGVTGSVSSRHRRVLSLLASLTPGQQPFSD